MANGTPNQQLQGLLTNLQTSLSNLATQTGGSSAHYQTYYQDVYNAITGSPRALLILTMFTKTSRRFAALNAQKLELVHPTGPTFS